MMPDADPQMPTLTWALVIATFVIAVATAVAAIAAACSARAARKAVETQLFSQLVTEYAQPDMKEALRDLRRWKDNCLRGFTKEAQTWASNREALSPSEETKIRDEKRRLVSHYFGKVSRILDERLIKDGLKEELKQLSGKTVMRDVVLPLEKALRSQIGTSSDATMEMERRFLRVFFDEQPPA